MVALVAFYAFVEFVSGDELEPTFRASEVRLFVIYCFCKLLY